MNEGLEKESSDAPANTRTLNFNCPPFFFVAFVIFVVGSRSPTASGSEPSSETQSSVTTTVAHYNTNADG